MRDGIWKTVALPRAWRQVLRYGVTPAFRSYAPCAATNALRIDVRKLVRPSFIKELQKRAQEPLLPLSKLQTAPEPQSPLEQCIADALPLAMSDPAEASPAKKAIEDGLREYLARLERQCDEHCAADPDPMAWEECRAFSDTLRQIDVSAFADALLTGQNLPSEPVLTEIDLDQDDLTIT